MEKDVNLHEGHRERMIKKFLSSPESMPDHEILEILLFYAIPRKDTNPLAHQLIRTFGSFYKVMSKSSKELMTVDGVGEKTATYLSLLGEIVKRIRVDEEKEKLGKGSFKFYKNEFMDLFHNVTTENSVILLLDKKHNEITRLTYTNNSVGSVFVDSPELSKAIAVNKPTYLIIAHNHPSGNPMPSKNDDITTRKLYILCQVHGVTLADHFIVTEDEIFSYRKSLRLDYIRETADLSKILSE